MMKRIHETDKQTDRGRPNLFTNLGETRALSV